ncbi:hypothetical protein AB0B97_00210 [Micromonospora sp. NPDC049004]|uniref:hypothetical protein n=1 Tax=Micromonospora sp. NPDC049004 TaxID=3154348 RepID=UPI0033EE6439
MPQPQQHEDPMAETRQQFLQGLATMATVGEAGARWAAVGIQNKAAEREGEARRDQAAAATRREADRLAAKVRADRERMAASLDGDWFVKTSFAEAAAVWRTATIYASSDPVAQRASEFAEQRLRQIRPDLMAAYDRHRQAGAAVPEAMRTAAQEVWERDARSNHRQHGGARTHGGTPDRRGIAPDGPAALPPGGRAVVDDFDAAVRQEAMKLAEYVRPEALDELQRQWRATGKLPAGEPVQLLRDLAVEMNEVVRAGDAGGQPVEAIRIAQDHVEEALACDLRSRAAAERGEGVRDGGTVDNPRTPANEHAAGQSGSVRHDDNADQLVGFAAAVHHADTLATPAWVQAFPKLRVAQVNPAVAGKQPAGTVSAVPMRGRTR